MIDFESAFSDFLDRKEYDQASNALFSIVRAAFKAGWLVSGGSPLSPQKPIEIIHIKKSISTIKKPNE